jgi:phosphoglycolate phosphatase
VLLLFDVDGTLLAGATDAHRDALYEALREVHGIDARGAHHGVNPAGRTDGEIARAILLAAGVSAERIDERADDVRETCCEAYARLCTMDLSDKVLPGVPDLLDWLEEQPELILALLTGNFEPVARIKLRQAGIGKYFPPEQGAFGSDSDDRAALPPIARRRAGDPGHPYPRERTIVIGDTPRDIACAGADDVRCLAVATGPYAVSELAGADGVAPDASGLRLLLEAELPRAPSRG